MAHNEISHNHPKEHLGLGKGNKSIRLSKTEITKAQENGGCGM